jgi:tetratricopeptide (TPR) repeat protein
VNIEPGTRLGVYELIGPLGSGGMGEVYKARDTRLNRIVAIKVLAATTLHRPEARARFQREALAIAAINHPHICTLHDIGHENGVDFIVMEYVEGETLAWRLARGRIPVSEVVLYARDIARAVDAAHRRGVIHRDLKPANIMLTKTGAKLLDFGLAKLRQVDDTPAGQESPTKTADISHDGGVIGTLRYMAPEVLKGVEADARSDVFSFGAVLYEMLTGEPPFKGTGNARIVAAILTEEPRPILDLRPDVPPALEWITRTCLAKDPDERWQDAREVVRQLSLLEQGQASPATPTPAGRRARPAPSRVPFWALAAVTAAVTVGAVTMLWRQNATAPIASATNSPAAPHIVVLPCRPIGDVSAADRAQCDGLAATLTAMLGQLTTTHALQVTPAGEVHTRGITSVDDARRQLGATLALEGSLMRAGDDLRVTYALVDTSNRRQLDAVTLTAGVSDPFGVQDRLVRWATGALRLTVDAGARARADQRTTQSPDAYAFALQARGYLLDYQRPGAIDIAIGLFKRALDSDARYAAAHAGLGEAYWRKYEATKDPRLVEDARAACRQALTLEPNNLAAAYVCAGTIEIGTGQYEQAIALLERALQIEPANDDAYRLLARAQESAGHAEEALKTYTHAVELRPNYWATHVWLASFHRSRGRYGDAAREYERAVALTPDNAPVRGILAGMYMFLGRYDDALRECRQSIELAPSYIAYVTLGMTHYRMRRFDDAVAALEQARTLLEDFRTIGNLARAHYWAGRRDRARELFENAIRLGEREIGVNPRNDEIRVALADYYSRLGRRDEALKHLGLARLDNPHFLFVAAMIYGQLDDLTSARGWLDKALAAGLPPAEVSGWIDVDKLRM